MIKAENLFKSYGTGENAVNALKGISLEINDGDMTAIVGTSGSGKSTLLHILGGLDTQAEGHVFFDNTDILKLNDAKLSDFRLNNIGFVFQFFNLIPELTAEENIKLPLMMCKKKAKISIEITRKLGINERLKHYPDELSGGQKQRVAIARAIINDPDVIFCDEPTGALDKKTSADIMNLFRNLNEEGKTIIIVTHDIEIAKQCDRIIEILDGKVINE